MHDNEKRALEAMLLDVPDVARGYIRSMNMEQKEKLQIALSRLLAITNAEIKKGETHET